MGSTKPQLSFVLFMTPQLGQALIFKKKKKKSRNQYYRVAGVNGSGAKGFNKINIKCGNVAS